MSRKTTAGFLLLALLLLGLSCASARLSQTREINQTDRAQKVLIAVRESDFKKQVTDKLVANYQDRHNLSVVGLDDVTELQTEDYDAFVVMGARMGFLMFSARERRFLRRFPAKDKLIMVMTAANQEWEWDREDIDVITCASQPKNVDPLFEQISDRLDKILGE